MIDCSKVVNYFSETQRICESYVNCKDGCPLYNPPTKCRRFDEDSYCEAIKIVQKWSDEHPPKTYLTELLKNYPNVPLGEDGAPEILCPWELGLAYDESICLESKGCVECWNQPIKESEKNE